ncbi:MAG: hypothetical protein ACO3XO_05370 [Bdellovibrionota bacterium]
MIEKLGNVKAAKELGVAMLELAASTLVILLVVSGGVIAASRYREFHYAEEIVDRFIHEESLRPLRLTTVGTHNEVLIDTTELELHRQKIILQISEELSEHCAQDEGTAQFSIEMGYVSLAIDGESGALTSIETLVCERYDGSGAFHSDSCQYLSELLSYAVEKQSGSGRSAFALPMVYAQSSGSEVGGMRYLQRAVLIGVMVRWPLDYLREPADVFGFPQEASAYKIVPLRGDVRL